MLTHIVDASLDHAVARWIAGELAAARGARLRLVFGHVPLSSIVAAPRRAFVAELGGIPAFELRRERGYWLEAEPYTITLITIDGATITARAIAVDDRGRAVPFGAGPRPSAAAMPLTSCAPGPTAR